MYCFISALCKTIHNCKYVLFYIRNATARRFMGKLLSPCIKQYIISKTTREIIALFWKDGPGGAAGAAAAVTKTCPDTTLISRRVTHARTHATQTQTRNTISRLAVSQRTHPPNLRLKTNFVPVCLSDSDETWWTSIRQVSRSCLNSPRTLQTSRKSTTIEIQIFAFYEFLHVFAIFCNILSIFLQVFQLLHVCNFWMFCNIVY